jgi:hypothetical protein
MLEWSQPQYIKPLKINSSDCFAKTQVGREPIRRALKAWWVERPERWVAWLMLNPSTATRSKSDSTTRNVTHFTRNWCDGGPYDGWIAVNLYPFVSSDREVAWKRAEEEVSELHANLADITAMARIAVRRMVAFGGKQVDHDEAWLRRCLEAFSNPSDVTGSDNTLWCMDTNDNGHPRHPAARGNTPIPKHQQPRKWTWPS